MGWYEDVKCGVQKKDSNKEWNDCGITRDLGTKRYPGSR